MFHVEFFCEVGPKTAIYLQFQYAYIVFHVVINFTSRVQTECEPKGHLRVGMHNTDDKQLAYFIHLFSGYCLRFWDLRHALAYEHSLATYYLLSSSYTLYIFHENDEHAISSMQFMS